MIVLNPKYIIFLYQTCIWYSYTFDTWARWMWNHLVYTTKNQIGMMKKESRRSKTTQDGITHVEQSCSLKKSSVSGEWGSPFAPSLSFLGKPSSQFLFNPMSFFFMNSCVIIDEGRRETWCWTKQRQRWVIIWSAGVCLDFRRRCVYVVQKKTGWDVIITYITLSPHLRCIKSD